MLFPIVNVHDVKTSKETVGGYHYERPIKGINSNCCKSTEKYYTSHPLQKDTTEETSKSHQAARQFVRQFKEEERVVV